MGQSETINIGLAGLGNVGTGVFKNLVKNRALLEERTGVRLRVTRIAVRDASKRRDIPTDGASISTDWHDLVDDPEIQIIVELIGGTTEARQLVTMALRKKKIVVTGNKALLAEHGRELIALAEEENTPLYFEAAVAGGIPIIKAVGEALIGNHILAIYGIINGTSNFILTQMAERDLPFEAALKEAQEKGYAEADPALDINGWDAAHKAIILAWLSYGFWLEPDEIHVEGIANITLDDIHLAERLGYRIKLLAVVRLHDDASVEVRVQPSLLPAGHILSSVNGVFNAVSVHGDVVGETLFYGSGAGQDATSSSVISDLADAAESLQRQTGRSGFLPRGAHGKPKPVEETESGYFLRLTVKDEVGVVARIAAILATNHIGILSLLQPESAVVEGHALLVFMLHTAPLGTARAALAAIQSLDVVIEAPSLLRVETLEA